MNSTPPPPRYRIVEKGRRLVTVDTQTGQEIGLAAHVPGTDPVFGASAAPSARPVTMAAPSPRPSAQPLAGAAAASPWGERDTLDEDMRQIAQTMGMKPSALRWMVLIGGVGLAAVLLIVTQLWFVPVALLLFPLTRGWTFEGLKNVFTRAADWANAG